MMYQGQPTGRTHLATGTSWEEANLGSLLARGRTGYLRAWIAPCAPPTPILASKSPKSTRQSPQAYRQLWRRAQVCGSAALPAAFPTPPHQPPLPSWLSACGPTATAAGEGAAEAAGERAAPALRGADAPGGGEEARGARAGTAGPGAHSWPQRELQRQLTVPGVWVTVS